MISLNGKMTSPSQTKLVIKVILLRCRGFSLYFLMIPREGEVFPTPGTAESEDYLWSMSGTCLELTHNHGSETDDNFKVRKVT